MIIRSIAGHATFLVFNLSFLFGSVSFNMIVFQLNPFFISIFAYFVNGEIVKRFEIIGIVLCFTGICILGLSTMTKKIDNPDSWNGMLGIVLPLVTSVGLAMVAVILRYLRELHFT